MNIKPPTFFRFVLIAAPLIAAPAVGCADTIYEANYDPNGDGVATYDSTTGGYLGAFGNNDLTGATAMAFDAHGDLFVADSYGNYITEINPNGTSSVFATGVGVEGGMAFDSAGDLYVAGFQANDIVKFTPGGGRSVFASGLSEPTGLAFDSAGNLYVANYYSQTIEKFTPGGSGSIFANTGLDDPWGLAFDKSGNLYAANFWGNNIEKFTPGGVGSVFATVTSASSSLRELAFDSAGNLYATDYANSSIMEFSPDGAGNVFAVVGFNPEGLAIQAVPEPSTFALGFIGGLALLWSRRVKASKLKSATV